MADTWDNGYNPLVPGATTDEDWERLEAASQERYRRFAADCIPTNSWPKIQLNIVDKPKQKYDRITTI